MSWQWTPQWQSQGWQWTPEWQSQGWQWTPEWQSRGWQWTGEEEQPEFQGPTAEAAATPPVKVEGHATAEAAATPPVKVEGLPVKAMPPLKPRPPAYPPTTAAEPEDLAEDEGEEDEAEDEARDELQLAVAEQFQIAEEADVIIAEEAAAEFLAARAQEEEFHQRCELMADWEDELQRPELQPERGGRASSSTMELQPDLPEHPGDDDDGDDGDDDIEIPSSEVVATMVENYRDAGLAIGSSDMVSDLYAQLAVSQAPVVPRPLASGPQRRGTKRRGGRLVQKRRLYALLAELGVAE
jgi:hypothetical protein